VTRLVDVVNFNADASCLAAADWFPILEGGEGSPLCRWLSLFVELERKAVLGFVGGTIADMATFNPESIALINAHPRIFEIVLRPFSHDVGLLRTTHGFVLNASLGRAVSHREFRNVIEFFLPPEFMLSNAQVKLLADSGVAGVFLNPARFKDEVQSRIPALPYLLEGVLGSKLACVPFRGALTERYLDSLHAFEGDAWNRAVMEAGEARVFAWRDGESSFLLPDGLERERAWLAAESGEIRRESLGAALADLRFVPGEELPARCYRTYPVHSFSAWFKEFRMLGFLGRLDRIEARLDSLPADLRVIWLQAINSDVLSAVEKESPVVMLRSRPGGPQTRYTLERSERGFEGEDYMAILESLLQTPGGKEHLTTSDKPHLRKLRARIDYVRGLST
jgi:hypothetical protein